MSYPGYPSNNSAYPPNPSTGFPQPTPNSGYPPYGAGNAPNPQPTVGFNVGAYPPSPAAGSNYPIPPSAGSYPPSHSTGGYPPPPGISGGSYPPGPPSGNYPPGPPAGNYPSGPSAGGYPPPFPGQSTGGYPPPPGSSVGSYPPPLPGQSAGGYPPPPGSYPPGPTAGGYPPPPHGSTSGGYPPGPPVGGYPPPAGSYGASGFPPQYPPSGAPNPAHYNMMPGRVDSVDGHHPSVPVSTGAAAAGLAVASAEYEIKQEIRDEKLEELEEAIKRLTGKMEEQKEKLEDKKDELEDKVEKKEEHKKHIEERKTEGTIKEHHPFEPKEDAAALKKAMKGLGTNEKVIIDILTTRTNEQRQKIAHEYKNSSGKDLMKSLKSELAGHLEDAVLALMTPREKYLAECLHSAVAGSGTNERLLVEVLCSATNQELHKINAFYKEIYGKQLDKDIAGDTSGYFKGLLVAIDLGNRDDSREVDEDEAEKDAKVIHEAGLKKMAAGESAFTKMLVSKSYAQLRATFAEFEKLYKDSIEAALKKELSGDVLNAMLALVSCIKHKEKYFAEQLQNAMKGMGTKDKTLIRIIVSRSEIDLKEIKEEYHKAYGKALEAMVKSEASGDYRKVLLAIIK